MLSSLRSSSVRKCLKANFAVAVNATKQGDKFRLPLAKIVATIGPASENLPVLPAVVDAGMRVMRINFSHATYEEADLRVNNLKKCVGINNDINMRSIMLDTKGPEIRTGSFGNNVKELDLTLGEKVTLTTDEAFRNNQSKDIVWLSYRKLYDTMIPGSCVLLDDGAIEVQCDSKSLTDKGEANIICTVVNSGTLGNKKGVNMPGLKVDLPAMSEQDRTDIRWGIKNDIDFIAASFVRKPQDVHDIRKYAADLIKEIYPTTYKKYAVPRIISKIESTEALENYDEILEVSDAIMVARGDLAVEIPIETLAVVQKEIVRKSVLAGKPVIVATQMLESMQKNPRPTRAEALDVANALIDGADAVMLSGESAKGKYPVGAVATMQRIITHTEHAYKNTDVLSLPSSAVSRGAFSENESVAYSLAQASDVLKDLKYILIHLNDSQESYDNVFSKHTLTEEITALVSKHRPQVPILVTVPTHKAGRLLQLYRGVHPIIATQGSADCSAVLSKLEKLTLAVKGDSVLVLSQRDNKLTTTVCNV